MYCTFPSSSSVFAQWRFLVMNIKGSSVIILRAKEFSVYLDIYAAIKWVWSLKNSILGIFRDLPVVIAESLQLQRELSNIGIRSAFANLPNASQPSLKVMMTSQSFLGITIDSTCLNQTELHRLFIRVGCLYPNQWLAKFYLLWLLEGIDAQFFWRTTDLVDHNKPKKWRCRFSGRISCRYYWRFCRRRFGFNWQRRKSVQNFRFRKTIEKTDPRSRNCRQDINKIRPPKHGIEGNFCGW